MLEVTEFFENRQITPFILGDKLFGIMPDWNPAEIIGTKPNVLTASIYVDCLK